MKHRLSSALVVVALSLALFVTPTFAATLVVDGGDVACSDVTGAPYCTIQAAIDAAAPGDTITVAADTYVEQLFITKSLILDGGGVATVQAPAVLVNDAGGMKNIVTVDGAAVAAEITGFTITGPGPGGCGSINSGLMVRGGADLNLHDNTISDIRDEPLSGCQNGQGIWVGRAAVATTGTATITNNVFSGYQKGGIVVDNAGSNAVITGNTVTGVGPTAAIAMNGIQVSRGATATVTGNTVSGHDYTGVDGAVGILLYQAGSPTVIGPNTSVTSNELGIWTDTEDTLATMDLSGVSGNVRDAVADFTGWSAPAGTYADDNFSAGTVDADGGDIVDIAGASLHVLGWDAFATIQAAVDAASAGDTTTVAAGTYTELVTVSKELTINGAGDGADDSLNTIITWPAGSGTIMTISASDVTINDLRIDHNEDPLVGNSANINIGASVSNITFNRITSTQARNALRVGSSITVDGLTVTDSHFDGNREAWYFAKETAASNPHTVKNVLVTNTTFNNNTNKGIYAEKLEDAVFDNIEVTNSGTNPDYGFNNGIDINLKWAAYQNITIKNSTITNSGLLGSASNPMFAGAIAIKARDQGAYTSPLASLSGVTIDNVTVSGSQNGIRFGEPHGANPLQAAIANVEVINSDIFDNTDYGLINETAGVITAEGIWWGHASGPYDDSTVLPDNCALALENPGGLGNAVSGCVDYEPWIGMVPGQPTLLSPNNNALLTTDYTPTLDWADVPGAAYYQIEITPNNPTPTALGKITDSEWTPLKDLAPKTRFFWRVRAFNNLDIAGPWSATWSFRTAVLAPTLQLPGEGAVLTDRTPTFTWNAAGGAQNYKLEVSLNQSFAHLLASETVSGLTYTLPNNLRPDRVYYWRVRTNSTQFGPSAWSTVRTFREAALPISAPILQKPNNMGTITDQTPGFNWQDSSGATGYTIQISRLANFSKLVKTANVTNSQYVIPNTLQKNVTFYWRVRANGTDGSSGWSEVWSFRIN